MTTQKFNSRLEEIMEKVKLSRSRLDDIRSDLERSRAWLENIRQGSFTVSPSADVPVNNLESSLKRRTGILTQEQKAFWERYGYLILPGFFSSEEMDSLIALHEKVWQESPCNVVVDDLFTNRRCYISSLSSSEKEHRFKVNDLYLNYEEVREISLNRQLAEILTYFLKDVPVLCNTLSLDYGTEQAFHVDSLYMTPITDHQLVATWIALEDCHPDAGPLRYYPGSHKIPIYRFSTGSPHAILSEMPSWQAYMSSQVEKLGLKEERFMPKKGDCLIWEAQLLHGGSPINNSDLTRKSLVSHYWTEGDCRRLGSNLVPIGKSYWMNRPPQTVNE